MNDTPTPRTDAELFLSRGMGMVPTLPKEAVRAVFSRTLERELAAVTEQLAEAREYADRLAEGLPEGMLPKDVEVLREANLNLATELAAVTAQRDTLAEALQKLADCDWSISLPDRMDAVRTIARDALQSLTTNDQVEARREKTPPQQ